MPQAMPPNKTALRERPDGLCGSFGYRTGAGAPSSRRAQKGATHPPEVDGARPKPYLFIDGQGLSAPPDGDWVQLPCRGGGKAGQGTCAGNLLAENVGAAVAARGIDSGLTG